MLLSTVVSAADFTATNGTANFNQGQARIEIQGKQNQPLAKKKFQVHKVLNLENATGGESVNYTFNPTYENVLKKIVASEMSKNGKTYTPDQITEYMVIDYIQTLNTNKVEGATTPQTVEQPTGNFRQFVEKVMTEINAQNIKGDLVTVDSASTENKVTISGLSYGYYFVNEVSTTDQDGGKHFATSMIMINNANPNASVVIKSDVPTLEKTLQNDSSQAKVDSGDFEIGQTIPYNQTFKLPNIDGYKKYKIVFEDKMSQGLKFHAEKSNMSINLISGNKTYKLKDNEYKLKTIGTNVTATVNEVPDAYAGSTFVAQVDDLKALVDREFPNVAYPEIKVSFDYEAHIDENAEDTGRPGLENNARLHFSNNPKNGFEDEPGTTPWDSSVAFTYKMNGSKINDQQKALTGAEFKLYSDKAMTNEVFVKKIGEKYVVINRDLVGGTDKIGGTRPAEATSIKTDNAGQFKIYGLDSDTYYLKEVDAPAGYRLLQKPIEITINAKLSTGKHTQGNANDLQSLSASSVTESFYDLSPLTQNENLTTNLDDGSITKAVVNVRQDKLPLTGDEKALLLTGLGAISITVGLYFVVKSKREENA